MNTDILLKRLKKVKLLQGLDDELLFKLANSGVWKIHQTNEVVFWEGDFVTNLFYLQYGSLKAVKTSPDRRQQVLRVINADEIFHETEVLTKRAKPAIASNTGGIYEMA